MSSWTSEIEDQIAYIKIADWEAMGVDAVFSCRAGGDSLPHYNTLNLALHVGDEPETVLMNRSRLMQVLGASTRQMVCCQQVHGTRVQRATRSDAGCGALDMASAIPDCDALLTNNPGLYLTEFFADCFPLYFFDPVRRVVALAHAGWKGTIGRIAEKTLLEMNRCFACRYEDIRVFIGPGIGPCCFEIGPDLAGRVVAEFPDQPRLLRSEAGRTTWDLAFANTVILVGMGVKPENIQNCGLCTSCHPELFYSYRRDDGITGRMGAVIGLRW
ncbi:MAG: peptidoglycan editing factor PgeF [Syntrophomonadaceae bacterium]